MNNYWLHEPFDWKPTKKLGGGWIAHGKDAPSAPPAPDYAAAARSQGAANLETARAQGRMSNPNIITPYGTQTVSWGNQRQGTPQQAVAPAAAQAPVSPVTPTSQMPASEVGASGSGSFGFQSSDPAQAQTSTGSTNPAGYNSSDYSGDQPTVTQTLAPAQQQLLDSSNRISQNLADVGEAGLGRVGSAMGTPFDTSAINPVSTNAGVNPNYTSGVAAPNLATGYNSGGDVQRQINTNGVAPIPAADAQARQHAEDTAYQAATSRLDPQWQQAQQAQQTQLMNQGVAPGSEAYNNAMRVFNQGRNDAYQQAQANAVNQGLTNQQAQFGMGLAANQTGFGQAQGMGQFANTAQGQANAQNLAAAGFGNQAGLSQFGMGQQNAGLNNQVGQQQFQQGLANANLGNAASQQQLQQQAYLRSLPLNELNSLRTGAQVTNPQFQPYQGSQIGQTPVFQGAQAQGTANQNLYNQQAASAGQFNSGLMSMLGTAAGGYFSDRRLKSNIERIGTHPLGIGIYAYDIFGHREVGVMAQEALEVRPDAVLTHPSGFLMVDYGRL